MRMKFCWYGGQIWSIVVDKPSDDTGHEEVTRLSTFVVSRIRHELNKQAEAAAMRPQIEDTSENLVQLHLGE